MDVYHAHHSNPFRLLGDMAYSHFSIQRTFGLRIPGTFFERSDQIQQPPGQWSADG